jgi:hypothetical protein
MDKLKSIFSQYQSSLLAFKQYLELPQLDVVRDSAIKRFEITFEISWKLLKEYFEEKEGVIQNRQNHVLEMLFSKISLNLIIRGLEWWTPEMNLYTLMTKNLQKRCNV